MEDDKVSSMRVKNSTKERLGPYKKTYGTYEKAILELIEFFEGGLK